MISLSNKFNYVSSLFLLFKDLEDFVSGAGEDGFIIVSFGSIVRGADMPIRTRDHMLSAFGRLRQRVVWKWEDDSKLSNYSVPSNIKLMPWIPQQVSNPNLEFN